MIRLKMKINSMEIKDDYSFEDNIFYIEKEYHEQMTFKEVLDRLYDEYKIGKNFSEIKYDSWNLNEVLWGDMFSKYICNSMDYSLEDYFPLSLLELDNQFNISNKTFDLWINVDGIGEVLGEKEGVRFLFHLDEKDVHSGTPHIHVEYAEQSTRVNLNTLEIMNEPLKKSKMKFALDVIKKNQKDLLDYWNTKVIKGEPLKFKLEL